jgi:hypothetical protein
VLRETRNHILDTVENHMLSRDRRFAMQSRSRGYNIGLSQAALRAINVHGAPGSGNGKGAGDGKSGYDG